MEGKTEMSDLKMLNAILTKEEKRRLFFLFIMSIFLSLIESIGISIIIPFITLATDPSKIFQNDYSRSIYNFFEFENNLNFMIFFGIFLIIFYLFRGTYLTFYSYLLHRFTFGRYHTFAFKLFKNYLSLPYAEFVQKNTADLIKSITIETSNLTAYLYNLLLILSEIFTALLLYIILLFVDWKMTLILTVFLAIKVSFLTKTISKKIKAAGVERSIIQSQFFKILNETFGNYKIIKLIQNENKINDTFAQASHVYSKINVINSTLSQLPKTILETLGFGTIVIIVLYVLLKYENASAILPILSMYALALYRMLPAITRIMNGYNSMLFTSKSLAIIHNDLNYFPPMEGKDSLQFNDSIELRNISFGYTSKKPILKNISLTIHKGDKIAFTGESGSGKSTIIDILIGIYKPIEGKILIDQTELTDQNIKSWRTKIGYIPQSIYLFDGSVADNVAFGHQYDENKIITALKKANVYNFLMEKNGIDTKVGEGGIQLSGGQKQRIGIARALYSDPEILVLDEATSALDIETESKIMDEIYELCKYKTLIIIAHRLSTIERCNKKITIKDGVLI